MSHAAVAQAEGNSAVGLNAHWLLFYFTTAQTEHIGWSVCITPSFQQEHIGSSDGWIPRGNLIKQTKAKQTDANETDHRTQAKAYASMLSFARVHRHTHTQTNQANAEAEL